MSKNLYNVVPHLLPRNSAPREKHRTWMTTDFILSEITNSRMRRTDDIDKDSGKSRFIAMIDGEPLTRLWTDDVTNNKITDDVCARITDVPSQMTKKHRGSATSEIRTLRKNENEAADALSAHLRNQNGLHGLWRQRPKADGRWRPATASGCGGDKPLLEDVGSGQVRKTAGDNGRWRRWNLARLTLG